MANSSNNRSMAERQVNNWYRRKFRWFNRCVYCGAPAQCQDHVWPLTRAAGLDLHREVVQRQLGQGLNLVPACHDCNAIAGEKPFTSIRDKRLWIQGQLAKKHAKLLAMIVWDDDELRQLGRTLRTTILSHMEKGYQLRLRLAWPKAPRLTGWDGFLKYTRHRGL